MSDKNKDLKKKLFSRKKNGWDEINKADVEAMEAYCEDYKRFLDSGKTERLCAEQIIMLAKKAGYVPYERGMALNSGDKVYVCNRGKSVMLAHLGNKTLE